MFSCIMKEIVRKYGMDISDAFVDGTKLEANANKYKFVWRPGKRHDKLNEGLRTVISAYFPLPAGKKEFISKEAGSYLSMLGRKIADAVLAIVSGSGHRQVQIVRDFHTLEKMLLKTLEYEEIGEFPKRLCAGSGYGSLENYRYMAAAGIENYVKPQTWQKMVGGEYVELCHFDEERNLICLDGREVCRM